MDPEYIAADRGSHHGPDRVYLLDLTVMGQTFKFEGPTFPDGLPILFQSWLNAVGPTLEAQALIDKVTATLKASTDTLADDVTASTPTTA